MALYAQLFTSFFLFLIISSFFSQSILSSQDDQESLLSFKSMLYPLNAMPSWNKSTPFCYWPGVNCNNDKRVIGLQLDSFQLAGPISPSLGNLSFLRVLKFSQNKLNGEIPMALGRLSFLKTLDLSDNSLSGTIPLSLANLSSLTTLNLGFNSLHGGIPIAVGNLSSLTSFNLSSNTIFGEIPSFIGNLVSLTVLDLSFNNFEGSVVPSSFGRLSKLTWLRLLYCNISGVFHPSIWNISSLVYIMIGGNELNGTIPTNVGDIVPNLEKLYLYENQFHGSLPASLSNTSLSDIELNTNYFNGAIPPELEALKNVKRFSVPDNLLEAQEPRDWVFFNAMTNSSVLLLFDVSDNKLKGELPPSIANLSVSVKHVIFNGNEIWGKIPSGIGNLIHLMDFYLSNNKISGPIPSTLGKLQYLGVLHLYNNKLTGEVPLTFGNITRLIQLELGKNVLNGTIPSTLGKLRYLESLDLSKNELTGNIPKEIVNMPSLSLYLNLSHNYLTGTIPNEVGNLQNLVEFHAEDNELSGEIPSNFGNCQLLQRLFLQGNSFRGIIPSSFSILMAIQEMDLSSNNLSGNIPTFFEDFSSLDYLNLSFNNFVGEVPKTGIFANSSAVEVQGNTKLCGGIEVLNLPPCSSRPNKKNHLTLILSIAISVVVIAIICSVLILRFKSRNASLENLEIGFPNKHRVISYSELFNATNRFSETSLIGVGGFSLVYKGELQDQNDGSSLIMAIKVFNLESHVALTSFKSECEVMRNLRHRNIIKTITTCSSIDYNGNYFKAIVFEYMPNGSLDDWLHPKEDNKTLNFEQRLNIAIDVASALDYLHNHCEKQIVHCDLKPKNILLDYEMVACVGDFGLARFITKRDEISRNSELSAGFKGTIGYAPPEYGRGNEISVHGDIYSYGILIVEMVTGKRPTDDIFGESLSLREYVKIELRNNIMNIIDPSLIMEIGNDEGFEDKSMRRIKLECINVMLEIGLLCSEESPRKRMRIKDVADQLNEVKELLLNQSVDF